MPLETLTEKKRSSQLLLVLLVVGIVVVAGSLIFINYQKDIATKRSQQIISAITSMKVDQLVRWNKERLSEVSFFSSSVPVLKYALPVIEGNKQMEPQLRNALGHILSENRYEDIAIIGLNGNVLFSVKSKMHPIDSTSQFLLDSVLHSRSIVYRDFYICPHENKTKVCYLAPILDGQAKVVACLFFIIDPTVFLYPFINSWSIPTSTAYSYLIKKTSDGIFRLSPNGDDASFELPKYTGREQLDDVGGAVLQGKDGFIEGKSPAGERIMAYVQPVPEMDWLLVSSVTRKEMFEDFKRTSILSIMLGFTLMLFLWGSIVWAFKRRQRRISEELFQKSRALHRSQEEFGATLYSIGEGVIATDEAGYVTRMNTAAELLTGWKEKDATGKPIEDVFVTVDAESQLPGANCVRTALTRETDNVDNKPMNTLLLGKDGRQAYIAASVDPIKGQDGKVLGAVLVFSDHSEEQARKLLTHARLSLFEYANSHQLNETVDYMQRISSELFKSPLSLFQVVEFEQNGYSLVKLGTQVDTVFLAHEIWSRCLDTMHPALYEGELEGGKASGMSHIEHALVIPVLRENKPMALFGLANRPGGYHSVDVEHVEYLADVMWMITHAKQKEICLLESEDKYRGLVNRMQLGLALHELILKDGSPVDYRFLEINPSYERITGLTREQVIGNTLLTVLPETENYWIENYGRVVLDKEPIVMEEYSGSLKRYYSVTAYPVGDMQFATIVEDVTEKRMMMDALRISEHSYRELIDNIKDAVWILELDGTLIDVNKEAINRLGYSKEEILELGLYGIDDGTSSEAIGQLKMALSKGDSFIFETKHRTKSGLLIPVEVNSGRVNYMGKQVAVCISRDITQRKRAEGFQRLLYEIAHFASGQGALNELLLLVRNELASIMDASQFYVALYQEQSNSLEEVVYMDEDRSASTWNVEGTLFGHVFKNGKSVLLCSADREAFLREHGIDEVDNPPTCWIGVPLTDGSECIGVLVLQQDVEQPSCDISSFQIVEMVAHELSVVVQRQRMINDLIRAKEKAVESDRLKTAFLANVSHEIRTPMNGILGFIEMLNDPESDQNDRAAYIDIVNKSGHRLVSTIDDIIEVSRIEAGLIELNNVETDLAEIMEFQQAFFQPKAHEKGIELILDDYLKGEEALVDIDAKKLDGILTNLLNNALKFTSNGSITFGCNLSDGKLLFYVRDTGMGIPLDRQLAVFDRFVQADLTTTRPYEGSGLGLSIVKAYLNKMEGEIWLESEPGKGSMFYFTLPYKPIMPFTRKDLIQEESPSIQLQSEAVTVLVAEDDPINVIYLDTLLKREGFTVYYAKNGREAVAMAMDHSDIDVILMDIKMPEMNGLDATREIRTFNKGVPIIAQTAYAFFEDRDKAIKAGCTDFLTKPTSRDQLLKSLKTHVPRLKKPI